MHCIAGSPYYGAWYETYGESAVNNGYEVQLSASSYPVFPGDSMTASILRSPSAVQTGHSPFPTRPGTGASASRSRAQDPHRSRRSGSPNDQASAVAARAWRTSPA